MVLVCDSTVTPEQRRGQRALSGGVVGQKPTDGYEERLGRALREGPRPMGVRGLHEAIKAGGYAGRGGSYGGVRDYAKGSVRNPRSDVLRAMAMALGVRFEWLAYGAGEMTEAQEIVARTAASATAEPSGDGPNPMETARRILASGLPEVKSGSPAVAALLIPWWDLAAGLGWRETGSLPPSERVVEESAETLLALVRRPVETLESFGCTLTRENSTQYLLGMAQALNALVPSALQVLASNPPPDRLPNVGAFLLSADSQQQEVEDAAEQEE